MIKVWVRRRIAEMMGDDDDIVANFAISQLEQDQQCAVNHPD